MAKSTTPKKQSQKIVKEALELVDTKEINPINETVTGITVPPETTEIVEEQIIEETPTSITKPVVEEIIPEPVKEEPAPLVVNTEEKSMEEKIVEFLDSREGDVKMNDFLKSLYPVPQFNHPPKYLEQGTSKYLKMILEKMQSEGKITIVNNLHRRLGEHWYDQDGRTQRYNLSTMQIVAKK